MKYYYTNPLKAAWMIKEHGFVIFATDHRGLKTFISWESIFEDLIDCETGGTIELPWIRKKYYIHPDCYKILKPQVGDTINYLQSYGKVKWVKEPFFRMETYECSFWELPIKGITEKLIPAQIIERNGLPFFTPEVEND